jgi:hypothetical protein
VEKRLTRVSFRCPTQTEVRYVEKLPVGGQVITMGGQQWVVSEISGDEAGGFTVSCRSPSAGEARAHGPR